ncbi:glycosyltransferase [Candidatus Aerophobetes bacterium]|uniref:Glycosyltransferase n=1 Tax=Aerophobetes bacterium TaxID=2030807 RepID=A0A523UZF0_UNCAE|nr:MAG: glycosyltransferase [Candidatus Aerophobetes bacterium]
MREGIALLHYSYPPVMGGVEFVLEGHARVLARYRHRVKVIAGKGTSNKKNIKMTLIPEISPAYHKVTAINEELEKGKVPEEFHRLKEFLYREIKKALEDSRVCMIHNVMTMHFNLPLTSALDELISDLYDRIKFYVWCHDATLTNPLYEIEKPGEYPWSLLGKLNPKAEYITISRLRRNELADLFGVSPELIGSVPDGMDIKSFLDISDSIWRIAWNKRLFTDDLVMLFPCRILKRKNYELAMNITAEIKLLNMKCRLLITAPPDPHNPQSMNYYEDLHLLRQKMKLEEEVIFVSDLKDEYGLKLGYSELKSLYRISDLLLITSSDEGFGIPILEAGAMRVPIACSEIPSLLELAQDEALFFKLDEKPSRIAKRIVDYLNLQPTGSLFKRVVSEFDWESIYRDYLQNLVRA